MPIPIDEYANAWRQVRIFSSRMHSQWYAEALFEVIRPLFDAFPGPILFVSRYCVPVGVDDGDTNIALLPENFLYQANGAPWHCSIRVRFRADGSTEAQIQHAVQQADHYWLSEFLDYPVLDDLGGSRFSPEQDPGRRLRRTRLVAELLRANTQLAIDALVQADPVHFEANSHPLNQRLSSTFQSIGHMLSQVWVDSTGTDLPILAIPRHQLPPALFEIFRL